LPLSQFASPLAVRMGSEGENTPFWARLIVDPDIPVNILDDLPLFHKDEPTGMVPVRIGTPPEWFNWAANLFGPQFSVPLSIFQQEEYGDVEAPRGLAEAFGVIDWAVDTDWIDSSSGTAKIPRWARSVVETAMPFWSEYRQFLGFSPTDPNRAAREGWVTEDGELDDSLWRPSGAVAPILKGVGVSRQTPLDTKAPAFEAQDIVRSVRDRLASESP